MKIKINKNEKYMIIAIVVVTCVCLAYFYQPWGLIAANPSATIYSLEYDGYLMESDTDSSFSTAWNTVHDDDDGSIDESGDIHIGARTDGGNSTLYRARIYRGFLMFDTSSVTGTINTAVLRVYVVNIYTQQSYDIELQCDDDHTYPDIPLDSDDYDEGHYTGSYGEVDSDDVEEGEYLSITITDTSIINKGGWTKICLRSSRDINDSKGTNDKKHYITIASGDDDEQAKRPVLLINQ